MKGVKIMVDNEYNNLEVLNFLIGSSAPLSREQLDKVTLTITEKILNLNDVSEIQRSSSLHDSEDISKIVSEILSEFKHIGVERIDVLNGYLIGFNNSAEDVKESVLAAKDDIVFLSSQNKGGVTNESVGFFDGGSDFVSGKELKNSSNITSGNTNLDYYKNVTFVGDICYYLLSVCPDNFGTFEKSKFLKNVNGLLQEEVIKIERGDFYDQEEVIIDLGDGVKLIFGVDDVTEKIEDLNGDEKINFTGSYWITVSRHPRLAIIPVKVEVCSQTRFLLLLLEI